MNKVKAKCHYAKNGLSKRVVVLKGTEASGFEEAIFILREERGLSSRDFLSEAERIVEDYAAEPETRLSARLLWILSGLSFLLSLSWILHFVFA